MIIFSAYTLACMKRSLLLFCLLASITAISQVPVSVFAGPQLTSARYSAKGARQETDFKAGFQLGMSLKLPMEGRLYFSPHGYYSLKGYKVKLDSANNPPSLLATDNNTTIHTAELAPLIQYDFGEGDSYFFARSGPSLDIQLYGKETFNRSAGGPVSRKMKYSFSDYGRVAANWLIHVGYQTTGGFFIFAQYSHGIANIVNADFGPRIFHQAAGVSVGYTFHRN
jgi:hypothetical protein